MPREVIKVEKWQMVRVRNKLIQLGYTPRHFKHAAMYHTEKDVWHEAEVNLKRVRTSGRSLAAIEAEIFLLMMPKHLELVADSRCGTYHWYLEGQAGVDIVDIVKTILEEAG